MATQAVKFYSVAELPETPNPGALYFVQNGELYKGAQRFGANKVFSGVNAYSLGLASEGYEPQAGDASITGAISGDIAVGYGAAKVFNGSTWLDLGADVSSIIAQISDSTATSTSNGITVSVTTSDGYVTGVSIGASEITGLNLVSATTGSFTNLVVTDSATFSATTVEASILTVNGSTVEEIAQAEISSATLAGSISSSAGTSLVNEGQVVNYVSAQLESFGNAMHFTGVVTSLPSEADAGDIVVIGTPEEGESLPAGLYAGQEYVYDGSKWEKIGDESVPSGGTGSSSMNGVEVTVVTAQATAAPTVTLSGFGDAAAKSVATTLDSSASNLPTESAVAAYVSTAISAAELVWLDENNSPINA